MNIFTILIYAVRMRKKSIKMESWATSDLHISIKTVEERFATKCLFGKYLDGRQLYKTGTELL